MLILPYSRPLTEPVIKPIISTEIYENRGNMAENLPIWRNLKIGLFHLGSGMADVLATGVWNRIMISDLGYSATPIGLLVSLRYFLAPLGIWAGRVSDHRTVGGYRRLFWVWLGRALMVFSLFILGMVTTSLLRGAEAALPAWAVMTLSLLLFSLGNALSGSTFLALIYDRTPEHQRGRAVGIVWTFLLLGFTIGGILFGVMLPSSTGDTGLSFTPDALQNLFIFTALLLTALWFFSLFGEERRNSAAVISEPESRSSAWADLRLVWRNAHLRYFLFYLALSMIFAFAQDLVLEPFAGDVFGMEARITSRFAAYWGSMSIVGSILFLILSRRFKRLNNTVMSSVGVVTLIVTFIVFGISALVGVRWLVTPGLILLGFGLGLWNIGTLGLMMDMSPAERAGTFLGFWTLVVTFARGFGVSGGGILRDLMLGLTGSLQVAYGSVFMLEIFGLLLALWALRLVNVRGYHEAKPSADTAAVLAGALD